jgi:hypothetical protein
MKKTNKLPVSWLVTVHKNVKTKDFYITLPTALCKQMDIYVGDNILWDEKKNGNWNVTKIKCK